MAKKHKSFVETKESALHLATAVADSQEEKTITKKAKIHTARSEHTGERKSRTRRNTANDRLSHAKEIIRSQKSRTKRDKAASRKATANSDAPASTSSDGRPLLKRKGVSFA